LVAEISAKSLTKDEARRIAANIGYTRLISIVEVIWPGEVFCNQHGRDRNKQSKKAG
jgi:hypothetical protein